MEAMERSETTAWDSKAIYTHARRFDVSSFQDRFRSVISDLSTTHFGNHEALEPTREHLHVA